MHPFELSIEDLEVVENLEVLTQAEISQIEGGFKPMTKALWESGDYCGCIKPIQITPKPPFEATTLALGEEGGHGIKPIYGEVTTLALGEEGGH